MSITGQEEEYRSLFRNYQGCVITLRDLFQAVKDSEAVATKVDAVFSKQEPITILIEGSAYEENIEVVDRLLSKRSNPQDRLITIDISPTAVAEHAEYLRKTFPHKRYQIVQADMNHTPLPDNSIDLVINDCTINFNPASSENQQTVQEIERLLKPNQSACLLSVAVDKTYDSPQYGQDQELVAQDKINKPGVFHPFRINKKVVELLGISRSCWPVPYYKSLFESNGLSYIEFDIEKGKSFFPEESRISYRRFLLSG